MGLVLGTLFYQDIIFQETINTVYQSNISSIEGKKADLMVPVFIVSYLPNGVIDIYRKEFILKNKVLLGKRCKAFITDFSQEIDTMDDLKYLKKIWKK